MRLLRVLILSLILFVTACKDEKLPEIKVTKEQTQQFAFGLSLAGIDATDKKDAARYLDSALGICKKIRADYDVYDVLNEYVAKNNWKNDEAKAKQFLTVSTETFCKDVQATIIKKLREGK